MKNWMKDATASSPDEVARMNPGLPDAVNEGVRLDTASTDDEVHALQRRLRQTELQPSAGWKWAPILLGGGLLLAGSAAAVVAMIAAPTMFDAQVDQGPSVMLLQAGVSQDVGPSVVVTGLGELSIDRLHDRGADVSLVDGVAQFEVDPRGTARQLVVTAADVDVRVMGTVFTVQRLGEEVAVDVVRGKVGVTWQGQTIQLTAGQSWRKGDGVASADGLVIPERVGIEAHEVGVSEPDLPEQTSVTSAGTSASSQDPPESVGTDMVATAAASPRVVTDEAASVAKVEVDPCQIDSFSVACAKARRPSASLEKSPKLRYESLVRTMAKAGRLASTDRGVVADCNTFLSQYGDTEFANDVFAIRVEAAFYGERASQVINYANAYMAAVPESHPRYAEINKFRQIATLRRDALDLVQKGECEDALPLLRDLAGAELGRRKEEARAWQAVCAASTGADEEAMRIINTLRQERLPPLLQAKVREASIGINGAPRERVQDPR